MNNWLHIRKDISGSISIQTFETFNQAFAIASKEIEIDFACNYVYKEDVIKDIFLKYKSLSYNFCWYDSKIHIITDKFPDRFYPHQFDIVKDYK